jgi:hypothetical protein
MNITSRIDLAFVGDELGQGVINEAALSRRARSFLSLVKGIIGLDSARLIKMATGKQTGMAEAAKNFKFVLSETAPAGDTGAVQTLGMGNNYRAVGVNAGRQTFYFLTPKSGPSGEEYSDDDVVTSLRALLTKMQQAKSDGNDSALQSYRQTFYGSAEEASQALSQKEQQRGGQIYTAQPGQPTQGQAAKPSNLTRVITPIVVQMAGKDGPNAAAMMDTLSDEEIGKAVDAHIWDAQSMTEYARLAWASVMGQLDALGNGGAAVVNSMAQTAIAYITFKYLHIKAQYLTQQGDMADVSQKAEQEAQKAKQADLKLQKDMEKTEREREQSERERIDHDREGREHSMELRKKAADVAHKEAQTEKAHAQAEAAAKRPL